MALLTRTPEKDPTAGKKPKRGKAAKAAAAGEAPKLSKKAKAEMDKPFTPVLPVVNLLSPEVQEVVEQQRLKRMFALIAALAVAAVAAVWLAQAGLIAVAQGKLEDTQAKQAELAAQQQALAPVQMFYGAIEQNRLAIQQTMSNEVLTSQVLARLNKVTPSSVRLNSVAITLSTAAAATPGAVDPAAATGTCPSQDPYTPAGASAGCVTVDGTATSRGALGTWLDALDADKAFTVAFIPSTTADSEGGGVTFSATIGLDAATVHQNRYANPEFLKAGN